MEKDGEKEVRTEGIGSGGVKPPERSSETLKGLRKNYLGICVFPKGYFLSKRLNIQQI